MSCSSPSPSCDRHRQLVSALNASTTLLHLKQTHAHLLRHNLDQSNHLITKLIRRLTTLKVPPHHYPHRIFLQVRHPNTFLWTALIRAYSLLGPHAKSFSLYSLMRRSLHPSTPPLSFTFSALFKLAGAINSVWAGAQLHAQKISIGGFDSDLHVNNTLIAMYVSCGEMGCARKVFDEMVAKDVVCWTLLIVGYSRGGEMSAAEDLFERALDKDEVAWTAMITGYVQNGRPRDALNLFDRMQREGVKISEFVLSGVISACGQLGSVTQARRVRHFVNNSGFGGNVVVGSAMVDMFGKCGLVDEALNVFDGMREKNVYTYSAMIAGLAAHGRAHDAIKLFENMVTITEVRPNGVTFVGLLTACSHAGIVEEGRLYFAQMRDEFGVPPTVNHYACMVDLLGRAGLVEEAYELIKSMPMEPHGGVWGALLGSCRVHANHVGIAEIAADHLFRIEPYGIGNYVLLSNLYASAGQWDKVLKLRKSMKWKELSKDPACSLIETNDGFVHDFFADDGSHPRTREIREALEDLMKRLKSAGYAANLDCIPYDMSDGEKERLLMGHSEKMALAFGLLTTDVGGTIRIVKNHRICMDCHATMSLASSITGRDITLRDSIIFHHFKHGQCSCGGFW